MLTAKQDNRLTAAENTVAALAADPAPYRQDKALQAIVRELTGITTALAPLRQQGLRTVSKGQSKGKKKRRVLLATVAAEVAGDAYSYAAVVPDRPLQASVDYNYSLLREMRDTALVDTAEHILTVATAHAPALEDYGITPARLAELRAALDAFTGTKNDPRQQISEGKAARLAIKEQFSALAALSEDRLDRSLRKYARSHPEFYQRIVAAEKVIDRPGGRRGGNGDVEVPKPV